MLHFLSILVLLVFNTKEGYGSCWFSPLKNKTTEYGTIRHYCEYLIHQDDDKGTIPFEILPGSKFDTLDCMQCTCNMDGLSCCGTGFYAGTHQGPDMCTVVPDGCQPIFVLKTNNKTDCFTRRPVQPNQYTFNINGRGNGQTVRRFVVDLPTIPQEGFSKSFSRQILANSIPNENIQDFLSNIQSENSIRQIVSNIPSEQHVSKRQFVSTVNVPTERLINRRRFVSSVPNDNVMTTRQFVPNVPNDNNVVTNSQFVSTSSSNLPPEAEKAIREYIRSQMNLQSNDVRANSISRDFMARPNIADLENYQRQYMANMESVAPRAMPAEATIRHVHTERRYTGEPILASRATSMWPSNSASKQAQMIRTGGSSGRESTQSGATSSSSNNSNKNNALDNYVMMRLLGAL